jgi:hypothetical protein
LQYGQREADRVAATSLTGVLELFGTVHLFAYVVGDSLVEITLALRKVVLHSLGDPLGEQRFAVEGEQFLLDHAAHQTCGIDAVYPVAVTALEPVAIQQRHEELEILVLAGMRGRGHQQQVPCHLAERPAQLIPLRRLQLGTEVVR